MTDRELLELAAKAADIEFDREASTSDMLARNDGRWWNPLTDDGDALRLAVKLGTPVHINTGENYRFTQVAAEVEPHGSNPYAATRRAIVRAAAELGKEKP